MKKLLFTIIVVIGSLNNYFCQEYQILFNIGYGQYSQKDLKQFQESILTEIKRSYKVPIEEVESFPGYINWEIHLLKKLKESFNAGIITGFYSTAGRLHYKDYSGEFRFDQRVYSFQLGLISEILIGNYKFVKFGIGLRLAVLFSTLLYEESLNVYNHTQTNNYEFENIGVGVEPVIHFLIPYKSVITKLNFGYLLSSSNSFTLNNSDVTLTTNSGQAIGPNWNGIRLTLGVGYVF